MGEAIIYLDRVGEVEEGTAVSDLCAGGILAGSADGDATTFSERLLGVEVDGVDDDPSGGISAFHSHRHSHRNRNRNRNRNRGGNRGGGTSLPFFLSLRNSEDSFTKNSTLTLVFKLHTYYTTLLLHTHCVLFF